MIKLAKKIPLKPDLYHICEAHDILCKQLLSKGSSIKHIGIEEGEDVKIWSKFADG